jgi:hypothetical protein
MWQFADDIHAVPIRFVTAQLKTKVLHGSDQRRGIWECVRDANSPEILDSPIGLVRKDNSNY